ncbi:MAG: hypothetical protein HOE48_20290 [Candidatus Latescibacteria bacterium]|jgi:site-specific DNA recombinase|nr:hypothetical protein [Candidatus Latescibacterota bacterium]MBT4140267.1 hypothetical protein [Candidatus Latescibacterota bacterium]MBT5829868.1 hypothetical protein [Candidatus Latescibacterota bacterium]
MLSNLPSTTWQWRAERGLSNGGQVLGYDLDPENPGRPIPNAEEKALLNFMYETYVEEKTFQRTAKMLNEKGYRTKLYTSRRGNVQGGNKFSKMTAQRLLTNLFYVGKVVHKGEIFDGQHEPIVPLSLWGKVQSIITANRGGARKFRKQNVYPFLLQGLVRCGNCNHQLSPTFGYNHQGRMYPYYACNRQLTLGKENCNTRYVPAQALEKVVAKRLKQIALDPNLISSLVTNTSNNSSLRLQEFTESKQVYAKNIADVKRQIDRLVEGLAEGEVNIRSVSQKILSLEEQKEQLESGLQDIEREIAQTKKKVVNAEKFSNTLTTFSDLYADANPNERKELMQLHIHQLIWTPNKIQMAIFEIPTDASFNVNQLNEGSMVGNAWLRR